MTGHTPWGKYRWLALGVGLLLVFGAVVSVWRGQSRGDGPAAGASAAEAPQSAQSADPGDVGPKAVTVTVGRIEVREVPRTVQVVGTFHGYDEVTVNAEVSGRVVAIFHDVGDIVKPGEPLLQIDPTNYELGLEETKRALELEAARIGLPLPPPEQFNPESILAILNSGGFDINKLPTVQRAKDQEELAKIRLERTRRLREQNTVSQEELDLRVTDYQVAMNTRVQAQLDAQAVVAGIKHRLVLLKIAEKKLRDTRVVVPAPAVRESLDLGDVPPDQYEYAVTQRKVSVGEMLKDAPGSSTAAFELVMDKVLKLMATVPERYSGKIQVGQPAEIRVEAYPDRLFTGKVRRVNPAVDRISRTFQVEIHVDNSRRELKAGGFAKAEILVGKDSQAWTVPVEAVVSFAGSTKVFVVREGKAHAIAVQRGLEGRPTQAGQAGDLRGMWVELVRSASPDLRLDDPVVLTGQEKLAEGVPVRIRSPQAGKPDKPEKPEKPFHP